MRTERATLRVLNKSGAQRAVPKLELTKGTFANVPLRDFVNDCIVPGLVDIFLRSRLKLPDSLECRHNVDHL
jgi:hypothetical protein